MDGHSRIIHNEIWKLRKYPSTDEWVNQCSIIMQLNTVLQLNTINRKQVYATA